MSGLSRRNLLAFGGLGAGTLMMPWTRSASASPTADDPHFFLLIMLGAAPTPPMSTMLAPSR